MDEFSAVMAVLATSYPNFKLTVETMTVYKQLLSDIPVDYLKAGCLKHATENKWFPSVAELRAAAFDVMTNKPTIPSAFEAWQEVRESILKYGRDRKPLFSHPVIERSVNVMGWKELCLSENSDYDRAHFFKVYESMLYRAEESVKRLPEVQRAMDTGSAIKMLADKLKA